jgi:hypothetical protein
MPIVKPSTECVSPELLDAIASLPTHREVSHCGATFLVPVFDIYATCPTCGARVKVRSFAGVPELEDVFDAVFEWIARPGAAELARRRQAEISSDE